jgi:hypothetical protein
VYEGFKLIEILGVLTDMLAVRIGWRVESGKYMQNIIFAGTNQMCLLKSTT